MIYDRISSSLYKWTILSLIATIFPAWKSGDDNLLSVSLLLTFYFVTVLYYFCFWFAFYIDLFRIFFALLFFLLPFLGIVTRMLSAYSSKRLQHVFNMRQRGITNREKLFFLMCFYDIFILTNNNKRNWWFKNAFNKTLFYNIYWT